MADILKTTLLNELFIEKCHAIYIYIFSKRASDKKPTLFQTMALRQTIDKLLEPVKTKMYNTLWRH